MGSFVEKLQVSSVATKPEGSCVLACPCCLVPLGANRDLNLSSCRENGAQLLLECRICSKSFSFKGSHLDMTINEDGDEAIEPATQFFRFPLVPFLYERGWRQSFSLFWGFPGPENELELMKEHLKPVTGGIIVDASCGSGLLSRRFAKSGMFSRVIALDFSEAMLQQCHGFIKQEKNFPLEKILLVRADIVRLPFDTSSIDAVHAGAALHCWPSPSSAVGEIRRVLKSGGIFVATTFVLDEPLFCCVHPQKYVQRTTSGLSKYQLFQFFRSEKELEDLCVSSGLVNFKCFRNRRFVMIAAMKPL